MDNSFLNFFEESVSIDNDFVLCSGLVNSFALKYPVHSDRIYVGFCLDGYAEVEVNLVKHTIKKNEVIFIAKNHIVFNHKISDDFRSVFIAVTDDFKCELFNDLRKYPLHFLFKQKFPSVVLEETEMKLLMEYYNLMLGVVKNVQNDYRKDIVKHLLSSLLINLHCYGNRDKEKAAPMSRKEEMVGSFFSLLFEHSKEARDVSFYADKLCVSPKYLSSLIKQIVGKPAKDCIDYCIILESKVLLNSSYTIQEISQQLNFPNQSFFGKYFKKHTGISPLNYRRSTLS